jgi:putative peptidoglycan lipid II flippase
VSSPWGAIVKAGSLLMVLELVGQLAALFKQVVVAAQFGTSAEMDRYLAALAIAWLVRMWVSLPIKQTVIPMFRHDIAQRGETAAWARMSVLFNNTGLVLLVLATVVALGAPVLVDLVAPGFSAESEGQTTFLVRVLVLSIVFSGLQNVLSQILFSYRRFLLPGIAGVLESAVAIAVLLAIGGAWGVTGLAVAVVLGTFAQFIVQLPVLWWHRRAYVARVRLGDPAMKEMTRLSVPLMVTAGGNELGRITDRVFASLLAAGSLSALAFAHRLASAANNLFIDAFQQATFPHFTQLGAEEKFERLSRELFRYLRLILFVAVPVAAGLLVTADLAVRAVYARGAFDETSVRLTSQALMVYMLGFPALSAVRLLSRTFFSLKDTRTPTKVALLRLGVRVVLCLVLIGPLGHMGIALADSLSEVLRAVILFAVLPSHVRRDEGRETGRSVLRSVGAAAIMAAVLVFVRQTLSETLAPGLEIVLLVSLGAVTYMGVALAINAEECRALFKMLTLLRGRFLPGRP